jgi:hypothetical protein
VAPVQRSRRRRRPEPKLAEACNHNPRRYLDSLVGPDSALSPDLLIPALSLKYSAEKELTQVWLFGRVIELATLESAEGPRLSGSDAPPHPPRPERPAGAPEESGLAAGLLGFSRRLANFGLGEAQPPLLTEEIWSLDANGNPR